MRLLTSKSGGAKSALPLSAGRKRFATPTASRAQPVCRFGAARQQAQRRFAVKKFTIKSGLCRRIGA
jgi:hypothetical protein